MRKLLDPDDAARGLRRLAGQIIERHRGTDKLLLVGVHRGGVPIAETLAALLKEHGDDVPVGTVDISLYRDDAAVVLPNARLHPTHLPLDIKGRRVVLCDDVLCTGRTTRAAVDALLDYGRPAQIELAVLLDRTGRELPIQADYFVKKIEVPSNERVDVLVEQGRFTAIAVPEGSPSTAPCAPPGENAPATDALPASFTKDIQ